MMVNDLLNEYLASELTNIVLQYCWPTTNGIEELYLYGYYEKISNMKNKN